MKVHLPAPYNLSDIIESVLISILLDAGLVILIASHAISVLLYRIIRKVFCLDGWVMTIFVPAIIPSMRHTLQSLTRIIKIVIRTSLDIISGFGSQVIKDEPPGAEWTHLGWILTAVTLVAIESRSSIHLVPVRVLIIAFWLWTATSWLVLFTAGVEWIKSKVMVKRLDSIDTDRMVVELVDGFVMAVERIERLEKTVAIRQMSKEQSSPPDTAKVSGRVNAAKVNNEFDSKSDSGGQLTPTDSISHDADDIRPKFTAVDNIQYTPSSSTGSTSTVVRTPLSTTPHRNQDDSAEVRNIKQLRNCGSTSSSTPITTNITPPAEPEVLHEDSEITTAPGEVDTLKTEGSAKSDQQAPWDRLSTLAQLKLLKLLAPKGPDEPDPFVVPKLLEICDAIQLDTVSADIAKELRAQLKKAKGMTEKRLKAVKKLQNKAMIDLCSHVSEAMFVMLNWNIDACQNMIDDLEDKEMNLNKALEFINKHC